MVEHLGLLEIRAMENLFFWEDKKLNKKSHNLPTRKNRLWNQYNLIKKVWCVDVLSESPSTSKSLISLFYDAVRMIVGEWRGLVSCPLDISRDARGSTWRHSVAPSGWLQLPMHLCSATVVRDMCFLQSS